jgi:hypothetical protein
MRKAQKSKEARKEWGRQRDNMDFVWFSCKGATTSAHWTTLSLPMENQKKKRINKEEKTRKL